MFRVKAAVMRAFEAAGHDAFVAEMMAHLRRYSPRHAVGLSEAGLRAAVLAGLDRAGRHGLTQRGPARFYLELMVLLGSGFDSDPLLPWAAEILGRADYRTPMDRADALHARVMLLLDQVGDERHAYTGETFARFAVETRGRRASPAQGIARTIRCTSI